jgi:NAD(P)-dependent dehydrogenase (short-subunit alcohol dehydrogenase family)
VSLAGQHALVTGAGRGIGAAIAVALGRDGARLTLLGRTADELEARAVELRAAGVEARAAVADVADEGAVGTAFARASEAFGPVTVLINNAGIARSRPFLKMERNLWDAILATNLSGTYYCSRAAAGAMLAGGWGRIVNVASTAGLSGGRYISAYCASKHGVIGLTRALAVEFAGSGVTVNAVCPGFVETAMLDQALAAIGTATGRSEAEARAGVLAQSLQTRVITPEEVAAAVLWLCGDGAAAITGQALPIEASGTIHG